MKFTDELKQLRPGATLTTEKTKAVCYVTAKRCGLSVTVDDKDGKRIVKLAGHPTDDVIARLKVLSASDRLKVFESFELCCGMNRGSCICEAEEIAEPLPTIADERKSVLNALQAKIDGIQSGSIAPKIEMVEDHWIELPTTRENGDILYWRKKLKGNPVCYKRERDWDAFA
jgi:hypothetical protein